MKKGEKTVIFILVLITAILIIVGIVTKNNKNKSSETDNTSDSQTSNVEVLEDGTKLNVSPALNSKKTIEEGLEVTDIQLTQDGTKTLLLGTITNTSSETKGGYTTTISFLDKDGNVIATIGGIVPELAPGETTPLESSTTLDYSEAYDFSITKN